MSNSLKSFGKRWQFIYVLY